jgi:diadenosine tetraphosphatase ApaH/serine/threonine PP2A family protein phosphatase
VARLRGLDALCLAGNHDLGALGLVPLEEFSKDARTALVWTQRVLTPESAHWLALQKSRERLGDHNITLVHASPRDPVWEYIQDDEDAVANMPHFDTAVCLFGHTHRPISYRLREQERILRVEHLPEREPYPLLPKLLLNIGSAGQPRDRDARAAFAILDTDSQTITQYRIEYDLAAAQRAIRNAGLPHRLADRLAHGV